MKPKIKECFYRDKKGKCSSMEIYRKVEGMETGKPCPFNPDEDAFGGKPEKLTCPEFAPKR